MSSGNVLTGKADFSDPAKFLSDGISQLTMGSFQSVHSNAVEKNRILSTLLQHGVETTVDRSVNDLCSLAASFECLKADSDMGFIKHSVIVNCKYNISSTMTLEPYFVKAYILYRIATVYLKCSSL